MKRINLILVPLLIAAAGFFLWVLLGSTKKQAPANNVGSQNQAATTTQTQYEAKSDSEGGVEVEVQPLDLGSNTWTFDFSINTHEGNLDMDILKVVSLTDDRGDTFAPLSWDGPPPGGHHRNGIIAFEAPPLRPKAFTVTVSDIGGIAKRTFTWQTRSQ